MAADTTMAAATVPGTTTNSTRCLHNPIVTTHHSTPLTHRNPHSSNSDGFSSRRRRRDGLWMAEWPPPPRSCPQPNHHCGGGRATVQPPQPHLVVSGCDGATPSEASGWSAA
nr:hypothetical protein [Tanacetum cinerariifolium]